LQPKIAKKLQKNPIFRVQGHSRSLMFAFLRSSLSMLVMISSMSVPICNHFYVQDLAIARISYGNSVCLSDVCHDPVPFQN